MKTKLHNVTVKDVMQTHWLTLSPQTLLTDALQQLVKQDAQAAAVIGEKKQVLGMISRQDILRGLWSEEFNSKTNMQVRDLMQISFPSTDKSQHIDKLIELFSVDKNKLFAVTDLGMLTSLNFQSYEERLRHSASNCPSMMPVIENEKFIGMISQDMISEFIVS